MAVTAFGPDGDAAGDVDDDIILTLLSQRPTMFQDPEVGMKDRVGALETTVDDALGHELPPECATMPRDIVFHTVPLGVVLVTHLRAWSLRRCGFSQVQWAVWAKPRTSLPAKAAWLD